MPRKLKSIIKRIFSFDSSFGISLFMNCLIKGDKSCKFDFRKHDTASCYGSCNFHKTVIVKRRIKRNLSRLFSYNV